MTRTEQYSWLSLAALGAVYWWFQMRMLEGWTIVDQPAAMLIPVYLGVLVASTVLEGAIALILGGRRGVEKDERDRAIEARANLNERIFLICAVNVAVFHAIADAVVANYASTKRIDLASTPTLVFVLISILFFGEFVKRISSIALYRLQTVRG